MYNTGVHIGIGQSTEVTNLNVVIEISKFDDNVTGNNWKRKVDLMGENS